MPKSLFRRRRNYRFRLVANRESRPSTIVTPYHQTTTRTLSVSVQRCITCFDEVFEVLFFRRFTNIRLVPSKHTPKLHKPLISTACSRVQTCVCATFKSRGSIAKRNGIGIHRRGEGRGGEVAGEGRNEKVVVDKLRLCGVATLLSCEWEDDQLTRTGF